MRLNIYFYQSYRRGAWKFLRGSANPPNPQNPTFTAILTHNCLAALVSTLYYCNFYKFPKKFGKFSKFLKFLKTGTKSLYFFQLGLLCPLVPKTAIFSYTAFHILGAFSAENAFSGALVPFLRPL